MQAFRDKNSDELLSLISRKNSNELDRSLSIASDIDDLARTLERVNKRNAEWSKMIEFGHNFGHIENIFDIKFPPFFVK